MRRTRQKIGWALTTVAAAGICGAVAIDASAQQRVGSDGRALDANNRIGAGGVNEGGNRGPANVAGNQIVTRNVTAGLEFRGTVPYTDPFAFRAPTAGLTSDRFIRGSAGVPITGVTSNNNAGVARSFYGESQTVQRPPGYTLEAPGTGYIPAPRMSREAGDLRMGRPFDAPTIRLPEPGQLILPGPVDPSSQQPTVITASPLYGVRQWNFEQQSDQQFLVGLNQPALQRSRLDDRTLEQLRTELMQAQIEEEAGLAAEDRIDRSRRTGARLELRLDAPPDGPQSDPLTSQLDRQTANQALSGDVTTNQRSGLRLMTAPERQSTQYAELRRRLQRHNRLPDSTEELEAHRQYNEQVRAMRQKEEAEKSQTRDTSAPNASGAGAGSPPSAPGQMTAPGTATESSLLEKLGIPDYAKRSKEILQGTEQAPSARTQIPGSVRELPGTAKEPPLQIKSLATGVQAKGLADFLREAEELMKQGKFYSALDAYDRAEQVAPNNPMVPLGRAIAELGAGYYGRADQHLREAFSADPALLMGQYDLRSFLGEERLEFLWNDLRAIANREAKEPRPLFLLAFIDYNTKNQNAAAYLDLAEKRAGQSDPFFATLRKYWNLPVKSGGDDANK